MMTLDPLFELHLWDRLDDEARLQRARRLTHQLPSSWQFIGIRYHALGDQQHACAYFLSRERRFVLIPGAHAILGYDRARALRPHQFYERRTGYTGAGHYVEEPDFPNLDVYLAQYADEHSTSYLTPLRRIVIAPFLLEIQASGNTALDPVAHHRIVEELAAEGFRLPTSDEWEYACAAGTRRLFRWGDTCPCDRYPVPRGNDEAAPGPTEPHVCPNAFGLIFSPNPYDWEVCAEPTTLRGGDGGASICGGYGPFAAWLSLAPAYSTDWRHPLIFGAHVRRAFTLPPAQEVV